MFAVKEWLFFFKEYIFNPKLVASFFPSSKALANELIRRSRAQRASVVVEIGTGTGVVTEQILLSKQDSSCFFAIEISDNFAEMTRARCPDADIVCADARFIEDILCEKNIKSCDSIVSCIPWATLSSEAQDEMIEAIYKALSSKGRFATLLLLPGLGLPSTRNFVKKIKCKFRTTGFSSVVWRNLPPAIVLWAEK